MHIELTCLCIFLSSSVAVEEDCCTKNISLVGAGSSFPALLYSEVGVKYAAERYPKRTVDYTFLRKNSGYGKERILHKDHFMIPITFAASEALLTQEEERDNPNLLTFPVLAGALVIIYNLPEAERNGQQIVLSTEVLAKIYMGEVLFWDHPDIVEHNLNVSLPHKLIKGVARSDNSGDTGILTGAFSLFNENWRRLYGKFSDPEYTDGFCCNSTRWPMNTIKFFAYRVTGMIGIVGSIPYTIGYAAKANVMGFNVREARLINGMNKSTEADKLAVQAAMDYHLERARGSLTFELSNALYPEAYPIASFSYIIVNSTTHDHVSCCQMQELIGFIIKLFEMNMSVYCKYSLVPLSKNVIQKVIEKGLKNIKCRGKSVYAQYEQSLLPEKNLEDWKKVLIVLMVTLAFLCAIVIYLLRKNRNEALAEDKWLLTSKVFLARDYIESHGLSMINQSTHRSSHASASSGRAMTAGGHPLKFTHKVGEIEKEKVFLETISTTERVKNWKRNSKLLVNRMRDGCNHQNLIRLLGFAEISQSTYVVVEYVPKGTLHSVLKTCKYEVNDAVKFNIALDVAKGLCFLHKQQIVHCLLSSLTCYVDTTWNVKIGSWYHNAVMNEEDPAMFETELKAGCLIGVSNIIRHLYLDPDLCNRTMKLPACDIYSFGILLIEIFTQELPFASPVSEGKLTYEGILHEKTLKHNITKYLKDECLLKGLIQLTRRCLSDEYEFRPNAKKIISELKLLNPTKKGIVDMLMEAMEEHMMNLEVMVEERTAELQTVSDKMRNLLNEVLPPDIATKLSNGETVSPVYFDCVTIFFSDIVGFTDISSRSTPFEVMAMLNDLWVLFDETIELFDVYKVDTIGDAYMVCSGLPTRNGNDHCKHIADLALALLEKTATFKIRHLPEERLKIRIGINSGPVTAGIVGIKMPQYCVFGDTVNTASRMESTSKPLKIQVSSISEQLYQKYFPDRYILEFREMVTVKGKGEMKTYWLFQRKHRKEHLYSKLMKLSADQTISVDEIFHI